ncbi:MAG: ATP-dependent DNA helicase RecG [Planctomycetota bacterium]
MAPDAGAPGALQPGDPITALPGVGPRRAQHLAEYGLRTLGDLLKRVPLRYERHEAETAIRDLVPEAVGSARGTIAATRWVGHPRGRKGRFEATLDDGDRSLALVWFNQRRLQDRIHPGLAMRVTGKAKPWNGYLQMANPTFELLPDPPDVPAASSDLTGLSAPPGEPERAPARLRPIYPAHEGLRSDQIERLIEAALPAVAPSLEDPLPEAVRGEYALPPLVEAFESLHRPATLDHAAGARRRLAFNELVLLQLGVAKRRVFVDRSLRAPVLGSDDDALREVASHLPFALTEDQSQALREVAEDVSRERPMNRLLQGDVGSGKTAVAFCAMLLAARAGAQAALLAPTEVLAEQHYAGLAPWLEKAGVRAEPLTADRAPAGSAARARLVEALSRGAVQVVVGTQALLSEQLRFHNLAVVVIDEQHRFGVQQRAALRRSEPAGSGTAPEGGLPFDGGNPGADVDPREPAPHTLVMTATPIPRTLALTAFGDLDVSTLRQSPGGRRPIETRVLETPRREEAYLYLRSRVAQGERLFVVASTVDGAAPPGSLPGSGREASARGVIELREELQQRWFEGIDVGLVHGRMGSDERARAMAAFRSGDSPVLVATTVIEVGVDVPEASLMCIEDADRFGLAQLHQLRGRIGRGPSPGPPLCVLLAEPSTEDASKRLEAIAKTRDGFELAEMDLDIRGAGEFFGSKQSGSSPLLVAHLPEDLKLLEAAGRAARSIVDRDPDLLLPEHELLRKLLARQLGGAEGLIDVG